METPKIEAVIFDCDGTLVDSETPSLTILVECLAELGLEISLEYALENYAGNELTSSIADMERQLGGKLPEGFVDNFRKRQIASLENHLLPIGGADDLLGTMKLPKCVASNAPLNKINVCLNKTGLIRHFNVEQIFSAYEVEMWKPNPGLFLAAAKFLNASPENCAVVEDSKFGIEAGLAAGMNVFAYAPHGEKTFDPGVQVVRDLAELKPIFGC